VLKPQFPWLGTRLSSCLPKRNQIPRPIRHRCLLPKNIDIAIIGANLIEDALRVVPLIEHGFDLILPAFLLARTERAVHRPFGPSNTPQLTSWVSLSSRATSCRVPIGAPPSESVRFCESEQDLSRPYFHPLLGNQARTLFAGFPPKMRTMLKVTCSATNQALTMWGCR